MKKVVFHAQTDHETSLEKNAISARRLMVICMTVILALAMCVSPAFASSQDPSTAIQNGVTTGLKQVYLVITAIVAPIAVVVIAFAAIKIFTGGEKGMQQAKTMAIYTVIALAVVYLAPLLISQVSSWFNGYSDLDIFDNPPAVS